MTETKCPVCEREIKIQYKMSVSKEKFINWKHCFCGTAFHDDKIDYSIFNEEYKKKEAERKEAKERYQYLMRIYIPLIEDMIMGRKFLDVGFTLPFNIKFLSERGWIATGIDLIKNDYCIGDFEKYDFKMKKFDFILMTNVLQCFKEPLKAIKKAHDLLNENGILMITNPYPRLLFQTGYKEFEHWRSYSDSWIYIDKDKLIKEAEKIGFYSVFSRINFWVRYTSWVNCHHIFQKDTI